MHAHSLIPEGEAMARVNTPGHVDHFATISEALAHARWLMSHGYRAVWVEYRISPTEWTEDVPGMQDTAELVNLASHIHERAERAAAMHRHPAYLSKRLSTEATEYVEHLDDSMPSADDIADMLAWADR